MTTPNTVCLYPHLTPSTAYNTKGCRCPRCIEGRRIILDKFKENHPDYHKTYSKAYSKAWYAKNAERKRVSSLQYNKNNAEKIKKYQKDNREKINLQKQQWLKTPSNAIKKNINAARCRAIRIGGLGSVPPLTPDEQVRVYEIYKTRYCLTESTGVMHQVDHIVPISKGGLHHPDNLQVLTALENQRKGAKIL